MEKYNYVYTYILATSRAPLPDPIIDSGHQIFYKYNKSTKELDATRDHQLNPFPVRPGVEGSGLGIDEDYIYIRGAYSTGSGESTVWHASVNKITKTFGWGGYFEIDDWVYYGWGHVVVGKDGVYVTESIYSEDSLLQYYDKSGIFKWSIPACANRSPSADGYPLATVAEYQITLVD